MIIKELTVGPIMANCFIVGCEDTKEAVIIDPGDEVSKILLTLAEDKLTVRYIINTHGHFDHVGGNRKMKESTGADLLIHSLDAPMLNQLSMAASSFGLSAENSPDADREVSHGDIITFGNLKLKVIHTPGHSPGGISLSIDNHVLVGDTLFAGSIGRTDLPGGDYQTLIDSIRNRLFPLGDDTNVYCGHGPQTTIGQERKYNPFLMTS